MDWCNAISIRPETQTTQEGHERQHECPLGSDEIPAVTQENVEVRRERPGEHAERPDRHQ
jgi:hypothetical protein